MTADNVANRSGVGVEAEGIVQAKTRISPGIQKWRTDRFCMISIPIKRSRLVYKPHSVQWLAPPGQSSLWAERRRSARCSLPGTGPTHKREGHVWRRAASHRPQTKSSLLGLAPGGGYLATRITARAGGLLHHLFTITPRNAGLFVSVAHSGRFAPLGGFPAPGYSPTPCSIGVRTFLDPVNAGPRLPDQPEVNG